MFRKVGIVALACFMAHALALAWRGAAWEILWICTLASLWVGIGALLDNRTAVGIGVSWLIYGGPLWVVNVWRGGDLLPTSLLTHVVVLAVGVFYLARRGFAKGTYLKAWLCVLLLLLICRAISPPSFNLNLVYSLPVGETLVLNHSLYLTALLLIGVLESFLLERAALRWLDLRR